jgi:hypothetical protein
MSNKAEPKTDVKMKLIGEDGNAFYILGKVCKALRDAGYPLPTLIPNSGRRLAHRPFGSSVSKSLLVSSISKHPVLGKYRAHAWLWVQG